VFFRPIPCPLLLPLTDTARTCESVTHKFGIGSFPAVGITVGDTE
jgi:hypothetical protein